MSKQERVVPDQEGAAGCCPALLAAPLDEGQAAELAPVFKALGDPVRLRLLSMIASQRGGEICVCDLTPAFDLSQPTISHHLKLLRQAGLIASERRGTWVYYRLLPAKTDQLAAILTRPDSEGLQAAGSPGTEEPREAREAHEAGEGRAS